MEHRVKYLTLPYVPSKDEGSCGGSWNVKGKVK